MIPCIIPARLYLHLGFLLDLDHLQAINNGVWVIRGVQAMKITNKIILVILFSMLLISMQFMRIETDLEGPLNSFFPGAALAQTGSQSEMVAEAELSNPEIASASATVDTPLVAGWNLVSFDVAPADTAITAVLTSVDGIYDLVYTWDGVTQSWQLYDPDAPPYSNSLFALDERRGFWIHMNAPGTLSVTGSNPVTSSINLYTAGDGWNLVGYPAIVERALPGALQDNGVGTNFSLVYAYHAGDAGDP